MLLCLSTSLYPESRSRILMRAAFEHLSRSNPGAGAGPGAAQWLDLADLDLAICDAHSVWEHEHTKQLQAAVRGAQGILLGFGIYNYAPSAIAKTAVELAGKAWSEKVVGFICAAGGPGSYMSAMPMAASLMLDFRCVIVPRFVYATGKAFNGAAIADAEVTARVHQLADELARMTAALRGASTTTE